MKICCLNPVFAFCVLVFLMMVICILGNLACHKLLPEIATENCCPLPSFYTEAIKEKCNSTEDHFKLDIGQQHLCFTSCALNEIGVFNQDEFQKEILESYLNAAIQDSMNIKDDLKNHFDKCTDNYKLLDSIWSNTDDCNTIREQCRHCLPAEL